MTQQQRQDAPSRPRVLVVHGPNLNLLGRREPGIYGAGTLAELDARLASVGEGLDLEVTCRQSNHVGTLIDWIHEVEAGTYDGLIINPGGYTHTSVAIADALRAISKPAIEVHLTNLYTRESYRHTSVTGSACCGIIMGLGRQSYVLALQHLATVLPPN